MTKLEKEIAVYQAQLPQLLKDEGKYAVIFKDHVLGTYTAYDDALQAGYDAASLQPFLVKKISGTEPLAYFSRNVGDSCRT